MAITTYYNDIMQNAEQICMALEDLDQRTKKRKFEILKKDLDKKRTVLTQKLRPQVYDYGFLDKEIIY